jgi:Ca-activated chloride channel homolog
MNINPDDPKWTAYVLGELSQTERVQVEKELESSAAAREVVEEIRLATSLLRQELSSEAALSLSPEQRNAIAVAAVPQKTRPIWRWAALAAPVAAAGVVAVTLWFAPVPVPQLAVKEARPRSLSASPSAQREAAPTAQVAIKDIREKKSESVTSTAADASAAATLQQRQLQRELSANLEVQAIAPAQVQGQQAQQAVVTGALGGVLKGQGNGASIGFANSFVDNKRLAMSAAPPAAAVDRIARPPFNTETYDLVLDNGFVQASQESVATFSVDVDTASYSNVRRFLMSLNQMPPRDSVRIEEMINYFSYNYPSPTGPRPIAAYTEVASAPWKPEHRLVRIGIKAKDIDIAKRPPSNLVFLIDVSGSMATPERLPMLKSAMKLMIEKLGEGDHVAIVTYAGESGVRLRSTTGDKKEVINSVIDGLIAGGSTNGASGIQLAYDLATSNFIRGGTNRVILATDGDFNVGITNQGDLIRLLEDKAKSGVFLSVLGFGMGNYKDSTLEKLADKGNGNYAYIDTMNEARKVLVEEMSGTLLTVAKDVKIQVEFNPAEVNAYRLIGYENRALRREDFNDDKKDAGDMGAGQTVTALFEVVPRGVEVQTSSVDPLKYQQPARPTRNAANGEILNVKIRYKEPEASTSQSMETPVIDRGAAFSNASLDFRFAAAVASFGMVLRDSAYKGQSTFDGVLDIAQKSKGDDKNGYRAEFLEMVRKARGLRSGQ